MLNINRNKHPHLTCHTKLHAIYETQASGGGRRKKDKGTQSSHCSQHILMDHHLQLNHK